jgi:hypothetical protein
MRNDHKDYSGTPLWKKIGIFPGARVRVIDAPAGFDHVLTAIAPLPDGMSFLATPSTDLDVVLAFFTKTSALRRRFDPLARSIATDGRLDFGLVQATGLEAGLVDNKSASITDEFQGVQFVRRTKDRATHRTLAR